MDISKLNMEFALVHLNNKLCQSNNLNQSRKSIGVPLKIVSSGIVKFAQLFLWNWKPNRWGISAYNIKLS